MKLRCLPEDFQVAEISTLEIGRHGTFAVYELRKSGWTTLDALSKISRLWNIPRRNISHAGLKDRHAETSQLITIRGGPSRNLNDKDLSLEFLGQTNSESGSHHIAANRFTLTIRDLKADEVTAAIKKLEELSKSGLVNYFDDQRFGSYIPDQPFIAEHWIRENYEESLRLAFAAPLRTDSPSEREQKAIMREHWGDWSTCKQQLDKSHRRSIVTFLDDRPGDFKGAWARVDANLRGLYLSAFQSHLWNRIVDGLIREICPAASLRKHELVTGNHAVPCSLDSPAFDKLSSAVTPLPSARVASADYSAPKLVVDTLSELGWRLEEIKVRHPRDRFFSKAIRPAFIPVSELKWQSSVDELSKSIDEVAQRKLSMTFVLPPGSYATMVVKRVFQLSDEGLSLGDTCQSP